VAIKANRMTLAGIIVKEIGCNNTKQQYFTELLTDMLAITVAEDLI
jgi:hypothetical protein